jgi:hypothetical protein
MVHDGVVSVDHVRPVLLHRAQHPPQSAWRDTVSLTETDNRYPAAFGLIGKCPPPVDRIDRHIVPAAALFRRKIDNHALQSAYFQALDYVHDPHSRALRPCLWI